MSTTTTTTTTGKSLERVGLTIRKNVGVRGFKDKMARRVWYRVEDAVELKVWGKARGKVERLLPYDY